MFELGQQAMALSNSIVAQGALQQMLSRTDERLVSELLPEELGGLPNGPWGWLHRLDGSAIRYGLRDFARNAVDETTQSLQLQASAAGALLTLGDEFAKYQYFDKRPEFELLRHLRNGVAHGNRFNLAENQPKRPAYFDGPDQRIFPDFTSTPEGQRTRFEIMPSLDGSPVLFEFMAAADVCDLLGSLGLQLMGYKN